MQVKIFFCYAHEDEGDLNTLKRHLMPLEREGLVKMWYDRDISAGTKWEQEIRKHLNEANIVLLLISHHFMSSDYCYSIELEEAVKRQERGEARVIPIILSPVIWNAKPLNELQALPREARPLTRWQDENEAF